MELPKAAGKVGVIEDDKVVYIEDYALQYIKTEGIYKRGQVSFVWEKR